MFLMPIPQLRNDVSAVNSTIRPEFHQYNAALQSIHCKRLLLIQASPEMTGAGAPMTNA